jgi:hypothetical protein
MLRAVQFHPERLVLDQAAYPAFADTAGRRTALSESRGRPARTPRKGPQLSGRSWAHTLTDVSRGSL